MPVIFQVQSFIILALLYTGYFFRKKRPTHIKIMSTAMIWDLLLILQIELSRGAIETAMQVVKNSFLLNFHITIAVLTVFLYGAMVYTGRKILKNHGEFKARHKIMGYSTLTLRTLVLITSYFIETKV